MKLEQILPQFREGSIIYRASLSGIDRTYYHLSSYSNRAFSLESFYISLNSKNICLFHFNFTKSDLLAEDWTICTTEEENQFLEKLQIERKRR